MDEKKVTPKIAMQVIERINALLKVLTKEADACSLKRLSESTGLHPSTTHRILSDLIICGLVSRTETGSYRLGMRWLELGQIVKASLSVRNAALDQMHHLHKITGQTVNLSVRQGDEITYIERVYSERSGMQVIRAIGGRAPLHLTSVGKLFLAEDNIEKLYDYVKRTGLAGRTKNSITDINKLQIELNTVKRRCYAHDNEELEQGVCCMASGIYDDSCKLVAGLSISAPSDRLQRAWYDNLKSATLQISNALGYTI